MYLNRRTKTGFNIILIMLSVLVAGLFISPLFAQTTGEAPTEVLYPSAVFQSVAALAGAVLVITAWAKKQLNTNNTLTVVVSGVISFALSGIGYFFQIGIFTSVEWWYIFIYGLTAMLVANGLSTWEFIKSVLTLIKLRVPEEKL